MLRMRIKGVIFLIWMKQGTTASMLQIIGQLQLLSITPAQSRLVSCKYVGMSSFVFLFLIHHDAQELTLIVFFRFRALGNHLDTNFPYLVLRAKTDISDLTELTFNYVKGSSGQTPSGYCSECHQDHCLCRECKLLAHKNL